MSVELKPCPFCGGDAELNEWEEMDAGSWAAQVKCGACDAEGPKGFANNRHGCFEAVNDLHKREAIAAWNRRAVSAAPAEGREAADDRAAFVAWLNEKGLCEFTGMFQAWQARAALSTAPMMSEADKRDAQRYRFIKSQMQVGAVQTKLPLYRTLHWIGYEDCNEVRDADAAVDAAIDRANADANPCESCGTECARALRGECK